MVTAEQVGEDFIKHYGVKGMKWGVRRSRSSRSGDSTDIKKLSDDELRQLVSRMQLEQQYRNIANASSSNSGRKFVTDILTTAAKTTLTGIATAYAGKAAAKALGGDPRKN